MFTDSSDDYAEMGAAYIQAWEILADACEIPPSLEVFQHELAMHRAPTAGTQEICALARQIAESYRPILA